MIGDKHRLVQNVTYKIGKCGFITESEIEPYILCSIYQHKQFVGKNRFSLSHILVTVGLQHIG